MNAKSTLLAALTMAVAALPAYAEQLPATPQDGVTIGDQFYYSFGGTYQRIQVPTFTWVHTGFGPTGPSATGDLTLNTGGPVATLGYVLDDLPGWLGARPRVELSGLFLFGTARTTNLNTGVNYYISSNGAVPIANPDARTNIVATMEAGEGVLRFKTDFMVGPMVTLTPGIGVLGGYTRMKYEGQSSWNPPNTQYDDTLSVKTSNTRIGGELSLDSTFKFNEAFKLHAGVTGAMYFQSARAAANLCVDTNFLNGGCQNFLPSVFAIATTHDNSIGYRIGASLGATYNWGWAQLTVMGNGAFNGGTPGVDYPMTTGTGRGIRISHDDVWSYGGYLVMSFPLN